MLEWNEIRPGMHSVLNCLTNGGAVWVQDEAVAQPIATTFVIPALPVTLIAKHERFIPANLRRPVVDDFYAVIHYISDFYECSGDQVRGWMAVQRLIHGLLVDEPLVAATAPPATTDASGASSRCLFVYSCPPSCPTSTSSLISQFF